MAYKTLAELRHELDTLQRSYDACGMVNVYGLSPELRADLDVHRERLRIRLSELSGEYRNAVSALARTTMSNVVSTPTTPRPLRDPQST